MASEIDTLVDTLRSFLKESVQRHRFYEDTPHTSSHAPSNLSVANRHAIGAISSALVQALAEQRIQREQGAEGTGAQLKVVSSQ